MELVIVNGKYVFRCDYEERDVPKNAGFRWSREEKIWYTESADTALALAGYGDEICRSVLSAHQKGRAVALEASRAVDADIEVPAPEGLDYFPFQKAGIAYAMNRPATLIADEMGLGKTIQVLGLINSDPTIKTVLVICPNSLKLNWMRESIRWLVNPMPIAILSAKNTHIPPTEGMVIVNYDIISRIPRLFDRPWDLLVCDESHYLKNPKAQRTVWVLGGELRMNGHGIVKHGGIEARRNIFLTGTPILNRPVELWPLVRRLDKAGLGASWWKFVKRYCGAYQDGWGWKTDGASNLEELQTKLRATFMVRRLKSEVLKELPPKCRQVVVFEAETESEKAVLADEELVRREVEALVEQARVDAELAKTEGKEEYEAAVARLREVAGVGFTRISAVRHATAVCKIPRVVDYVLEALESIEKLVVFAHHHDVVDGLMEAMEVEDILAVRLTGVETPEERDAAVEEFQNGDARVLVGSIRAAGMGLTLTAASTVVFAELDWTPGMMTQAEDRCHRIGQGADSVHVVHLVYDESLDVKMARTLISKQAVADAALDKAVPADELELPPVIAPEAVQPVSVKVDKLTPIANRLTEGDIALIHLALKRLAGVCDGAASLDGMGFNKLDARVGHELALRGRLTPRQAALGWVIARKYHRQLGGELPHLNEAEQ